MSDNMVSTPRCRPGAIPAVLMAFGFVACDSPQPPAPCGVAPQVTVNARESAIVTACFNDPNGDVLSYSVTSSNTSVATASALGPTITVTAMQPGSAAMTVTATDPGGLQGQQTFQVMVPNRAPEPRGTMPPMTVVADQVGTVDAAGYFTEPDGQPLTYSAMSSNRTTATVTMAGSTVTVTAIAKGATTVSVTARDPAGLTAQQAFQVTVPNRAPVAVGTIEDIEVDMDTVANVNVAAYFDDPDGDPLTYAASSSSPAHASVSVSGSVVTVSGVLIGAAVVTVTARDPEGLGATQTFGVNVTNPDRTVLEAVYDALGGSGWVTTTNWRTDAPLDTWHGVTTDERGRVVRLELRENGLTGEIPAVVGKLRFLERLDFSWNRVEEIPSESVGDTRRLKDAGVLPDSPEEQRSGDAWPRGDPDRLSIDGSLSPAARGIGARAQEPAERSMPLRSDGMTGPIPRELGNLSRLEYLDVFHNSLTGTIPPELGNLANLKELVLGDNSLTGTIPPELGELSFLEYLNLGGNPLAGRIPRELADLSRLKHLYLWRNDLTGPIPGELGNLSRLEHLILWENDLTGTIPAELGNLSRLTRLTLSNNPLTGSIPRELANLSNLERLYLYNNDLTGTIPRELGGLARLQYLSLPYNRLSGRIPTELGDLTNLVGLWLFENDLTGGIPSEFGDLSDLAYLSLSRTYLKNPLGLVHGIVGG